MSEHVCVWIPSLTSRGALAFRERKFSPVPVLRAHCKECKSVKYFTSKEWASASSK